MNKYLFIFCLSDYTPIGFQCLTLHSGMEADRKRQWFIQYGFAPSGGNIYWVCLDDSVALGD